MWKMQTLQKRSQHWSIFLNMLAIARVEGFDLWLRASPACSTDLEKIKMVVSPVLSDTLDHSGKKALVQCFQLVGYIPHSKVGREWVGHFRMVSNLWKPAHLPFEPVCYIRVYPQQCVHPGR